MTRFTAPLVCPSCRGTFTGYWIGSRTGDQQCEACGHRFEAAWPGFPFEPETVVLPRGSGDGDAT